MTAATGDTRTRHDLLRQAAIVGAVSIAAIVVLAILLEAISVHTNHPNSDAATVILEGKTMAGGSFALHGWALSLDSFWLVDALIYAVVVAIVGVQASLLYVVPALIAAIVIVVGATMARNHVRGIAGALGALTVVVFLALPSHALATDWLQGPLHIGTTLWCLVAIVALRRGRFGWGWVVAVVFLAAGALGDLQTVALGTVPIGLAGLVTSARCRSLRTGLPGVSAAVASLAVAAIVHEAAKAIGTFSLIQANPTATAAQRLSNVGLIGNYFPKLLGVGTAYFGAGGAPYVTEFAHGFELILIIAGVLVAIGGMAAGMWSGGADASDSKAAWRLEDPLVLALVGSLVVFDVLTVQHAPSYARYLTPAVIYGTILAGRLVTRVSQQLAARRATMPAAIPLGAALLSVAAVALLAIGAGFIVAQPSHPSEYALMGSFLKAHHLTQGVGDYWSSSIITVETNGDVLVRAVTQAPDGQLVRYSRESDASWYAGKKFDFVVFNPTLQFGNINQRTAKFTWGTPKHAYHVAGLAVLVYSHTFTVSPNGITT